MLLVLNNKMKFQFCFVSNNSKVSRKFSFDAAAYRVQANASSVCCSVIKKEQIIMHSSAFLTEFGQNFKPMVNTGTLKTECYYWFIAYPLLLCAWNTDAIKWFVKTGTSVQVQPFVAAILAKCREVHYSRRDSGTFTGHVSSCGTKELIELFLSFDKEDIVKICSGTFLEGWSSNIDLVHLHKIIKSLRFDKDRDYENDSFGGNLNYQRVFQALNLVFGPIRNHTQSSIAVSYDGFRDQNLSIFRFRDGDTSNSYFAQSQGLESLSETTAAIEMVLVTVMHLSFTNADKNGEFTVKHPEAMPGDVKFLSDSIPLRTLYSTLFSLENNVFNSTSNNRSAGSNRTLRQLGPKVGSLQSSGNNNTDLPARSFGTRTCSSVDGQFYFRKPLSFKFTNDGLVISGHGISHNERGIGTPL